MIPTASPRRSITPPSGAGTGLRPLTSTGILARRNSQRRHVVSRPRDDMSAILASGTRQMTGNTLRTQFTRSIQSP
jgi:hypothetical protein